MSSEHASAPQASLAAHDSSTAANDENGVAVGQVRSSPGAFEVPARGFSWLESESIGVVNLADDGHESGALGDVDPVSGAHFDVIRRFLKLHQVGAKVDDQAAAHGHLAQPFEHALPLLQRGLLQFRLILSGFTEGNLGGGSLLFNAAD